MGQVVWGRFAEEAFQGGADAATFADIPKSLRLHAHDWKDGQDLRKLMKPSNYYRVRKALLAYGIDVGVPCNVIALKREVQQVTVEWITAEHSRMQG